MHAVTFSVEAHAPVSIALIIKSVHIEWVGRWVLSVGSNELPDGKDLCFSLEDRRSYQVGVLPVSLDTGVHTVVSSTALLSSWSSQAALTIPAQQQIFFPLVDKDSINPTHQYSVMRLIQVKFPLKQLIYPLSSSLSVPLPHCLPEASAGGVATAVVASAETAAGAAR